MKFTKEEIKKIIDTIVYSGCPKENIECVFLNGSALYLKHYNDIDLDCIIKEPIQDHRQPQLMLKGKEVDICFHQLDEFNYGMKHKQRFYWLSQVEDSQVIYGSFDNINKYKLFSDKEYIGYLIDLYNICFFHSKTYEFEQKRMWNFLVFFFKYKNKGRKLNLFQKRKVLLAHDLIITKKDYIKQFDELKKELL